MHTVMQFKVDLSDKHDLYQAEGIKEKIHKRRVVRLHYRVSDWLVELVTRRNQEVQKTGDVQV